MSKLNEYTWLWSCILVSEGTGAAAAAAVAALAGVGVLGAGLHENAILDLGRAPALGLVLPEDLDLPLVHCHHGNMVAVCVDLLKHCNHVLSW